MIALMIISIIIQVFSCMQIFRNRVLHRVLSFSIIYYLILWITIPGLIAILLNLGIIQSTKYSYSASNISDDYIILYCIESIVFLCAAFGSIAIEKDKISKPIAPKIPDDISRNIIIFYLTFFFIQYFFITADYLTTNDVTLYGQNNMTAIIGIVHGILTAIVTYIALTNKKDVLVKLAISALIIGSIGETLKGSRIAVLTPIFIFFYRRYSASFSLKNNDLKAGLVMLAMVAALLPFAKTIEGIRGSEDSSLTSIRSNFDVNLDVSDAAMMVFTKFDSFSSGLRLIDGYGPGRAGLNPYIGSALVFLPRFLYPDRPVAGSMNDTIYGTPARLVPQLYDQYSDSMNVGVSPVAVSVWELGWFFGALAALIFGVANILIINFIFHTNSNFHKILAISIIGMPTFTGVFTSPDAILKNIVMLAIIISVSNFLQWLLRYRDSIF